MKTNKSILLEKQETEDVRSMVEIYQEVAAARLARVRKAILDSRQYYESLVILVREVRPWLKIQAAPAQTGKKTSDTAGLKQVKKTALFLSANSGLYGEIIDRTFNEFLKYITSTQSDVAVVGTLGKRLLDAAGKKINYQYFPCDDAHPDTDQLLAIASYVKSYESVEVFHGRFINLVSQEPYRNSLTSESVLPQVLAGDKTVTVHKYLFEPSIKDISAVFEGEVLASLVEQFLHESNFAKFAARMIHLDRAIQEIDDRLKEIIKDRRRFKRNIENKKQLSRFTGMSLWGL